MGIRQALTFRRNHRVGLCTLALLFASSMIFVFCIGCGARTSSPAQPPAQTPAQSEGFLATFSRWFGEQTANVGSSLKDARKKLKVSAVRPATPRRRRSTAQKMLPAPSYAFRRHVPLAAMRHASWRRTVLPTASPPHAQCARRRVSNFREKSGYDHGRGLPAQGLHVGPIDRA